MPSQLEKDFEGPYQAWKATPSPVTTGNLLTAVKPITDYGLQLYGRGGAKNPNLRSQAKQLTIKAFQSYDPNVAKLKTHLLSNLQGLQRIATKQQQIIGLPERVGLELQQMHRSQNELTETLGREPSDNELADYTGISPQRMQYLRQARYPLSEGEVSSRLSAGGDVQPASQSLSGNSDSWYEFVYGDLDPKDQFIMERSLGLHGHGHLTLNDIAKQMKITPGAVSQRVQRIMDKLNRRDEYSLF